MRKPLYPKLSVILAAWFALASCTADEASEGVAPDDGRFVDAGGGASDDATVDAAGTSDSTAVSRCIDVDPRQDTDGDGIEDVVEDRNRDCIVAPTETDPKIADTDGDGLADGDEDLDRDGVWEPERGESNPRNPDTDGDGILDGDEVRATVCTGRLHELNESSRVVARTVELSIPPPMDGEITVTESPPAVWYRNGGAARTALFLPGGIGVRAEELLGVLDALMIATGSSVFPLDERTRGPDGGEWVTDLMVRGNSSDAMRFVAALLDAVAAPTYPFETLPMMPDAVATYLRIAFSVDAETGQVDRFVLAAADASAYLDPEWIRFASVSAIAPSPGLQPAPACADVVAQLRNEQDIVLVVDPRRGGHETVEAVVRHLAETLQQRRDLGLSTRIWLVRGDAHQHARAGALTSDDSIETSEELWAAIESIVDPAPDVRLWLNAREAIARLRAEEALSAQVALLVVAAAEDAEFRTGAYDGRDGAPDGAPLAPGSERDARTAFYAGEIVADGAQLVAVGPSAAADGARACGEMDGGDGRDRRPQLARSSQVSVARAAGGTFVARCGAAFPTTLERALATAAPVSEPIELPGDVVAASARVSDQAGVLGSGEFAIGPGGTSLILRGEPATRPGEAAVGYLVWEDAAAESARE